MDVIFFLLFRDHDIEWSFAFYDAWYMFQLFIFDLVSRNKVPKWE
jgi:hypothetical protein